MRVVPPRKNCTWVMVPSLSAAFAVRLKVAGEATTVPLAGLVRLTVGAAFDFRVMAAEVVATPVLSVAFAVTV